MPDLVLTTDIIVGFPGETEAMFEDTLNLLKRVQYDMAYTFIYSPRTGTPAAKMEDQIPQEEKSRRLQRLMDVQNVYSLAKNKEMEDHVYDVIVEGPTKNDANHWFGRTTGNKMIIWENDGSVAIGRYRVGPGRQGPDVGPQRSLSALKEGETLAGKKLTPMMQQYMEVKEQCQDKILFSARRFL